VPLRSPEWRSSLLRHHWLTLLRLNQVNSEYRYDNSLTGLSEFVVRKSQIKYLSALKNRIGEIIDTLPKQKNAYVFDLDPETIAMLFKHPDVNLILDQFGRTLISDRFTVYNVSGMRASTISSARALENPHLLDSAAFWHRDATSLCYKLFLCLESTGCGIKTQFMSGSGFSQPLTELWELKRSEQLSAAIHFDLAFTRSNHAKIVTALLSPGDLMVFNTNAIHRGEYLSTLIGSRTSLQISFGPKNILKHFTSGNSLSSISNIPPLPNGNQLESMDIAFKS
jgi:hypothetical protein